MHAVAVNMRVSYTDRNGLNRSVCSAYALSCFQVCGLTGMPSRATVPATLPPVLSPAMTSMSVVLPAPEVPISAVMRPRRKHAVTPCSSRSSPLSREQHPPTRALLLFLSSLGTGTV